MDVQYRVRFLLAERARGTWRDLRGTKTLDVQDLDAAGCAGDLDHDGIDFGYRKTLVENVEMHGRNGKMGLGSRGSKGTFELPLAGGPGMGFEMHVQ